MFERAREIVMGMPCAQLVGAVGHHAHFTSDDAARARVIGFREAVARRGLGAFLRDEYPTGSGKAFIVNVVDGVPCLIDGNAHLVGVVMAQPEVTLADVVEAAGCGDIVRIWDAGWEYGSGQETAYDVYVPIETDISRIVGAREGVDYFKKPPQPTKIVPGTIASCSTLFAERDRGVALGLTAAALSA